MIARLEVTRGPLTEYPLAEKVRGGWQNGVTFYADDDVTKITRLRVSPEPQGEPSDAQVCKVAHTGPGHASGDAGYCEGCLAEREPQGEPSAGIAVQNVARIIAAAASDWNHNDCGDDDHHLGHSNWGAYIDDARAALRAAGVGGVR